MRAVTPGLSSVEHRLHSARFIDLCLRPQEKDSSSNISTARKVPSALQLLQIKMKPHGQEQQHH
eukprot:m.66321 g.66321  ORF g.66321 m.66321 type:complete len:64 (+) comp13587_c0_seq1:566-757(+)